MNAWGALVDIVNIIGAVLVILGTIGGCAYLITCHNWNPWWMLLAVLLVSGIKFQTDTKCGTKSSKESVNENT